MNPDNARILRITAAAGTELADPYSGGTFTRRQDAGVTPAQKRFTTHKAFLPHAAWLGQASAHCPIFPTAASRRSLVPVSVPMWGAVLSDPGGPLPRRLANGTHAPPPPSKLSPPRDAPERAYAVLVRVSPGYPPVAGGLHTRYAPVRRSPARHCCRPLPLDLHVLGLPLAFILSQDQTLRCNYPFSAPSPALAGQARSASSLSVSGSPFRYARRRLPAAPPPRSLLAVCSRSMSSNSPAFRPAGSRPGPPAPSKTPGLPGRLSFSGVQKYTFFPNFQTFSKKAVQLTGPPPFPLYPPEGKPSIKKARHFKPDLLKLFARGV